MIGWGPVVGIPVQRDGGNYLPILTMNLTSDGKEDS